MADRDPEVIEGRFWLPGDKYRGYGRIEFDLVEGVRVHLVDTNLTDWATEGTPGPGPIEVLHGETLGGTPLTLFGVFPTSWRMEGLPPRGGDVIDGFVDHVVKGQHFDDPADVVATGFSSRLHGLRELLTGGKIDGGPLHPRLPSEAEPVPPADTLTVRVMEGVELLLVAAHQPSISRGARQSDMVASAQWDLDEPWPISRIEKDLVGVLQDFILFATRRQSYVLSLATFGEDPRTSLAVWRQAHPRPREERDVYALALNLGHVDKPAETVAAWFDLRRRVGPVWGLFFAALDRPESLLEDRLLGLLAFAEGYHRAIHDEAPLTAAEEKAARKAIKEALADSPAKEVFMTAIGHANSQTQRDRLLFLISRALEVVGEWWYVEEGILAARLIHTRNWLVHWGSRGKHTIDDTGEMVELLRGLIIVLYVNILFDLGLDHDGCRRVIGSGWRLDGPPDDVF